MFENQNNSFDHNPNQEKNQASASSSEWELNASAGYPMQGGYTPEQQNSVQEEGNVGRYEWKMGTADSQSQQNSQTPNQAPFNGAGGYQTSYSSYSYLPAVPQKPKNPKKRHAGILAAVMAATVLLSGTAGFAGAYVGNWLASNGGAATGDKKVIYQSVERTSTNSTGKQTEELSVADVAKLAADSVVEIRTEAVTTGQFMQQYVSEGAGSGVIITADGYIVTNNHVIDGANKITVRLKNGQSYTAKLIGKDAKTDIAVIKIDASNLAPAVYGDSSKLVVGETAIAIGNPLGELGGTVTSGIISALDRNISIDGETMTLLQTNAEINPGNSGGGLFNAYGELIGIVNAKSTGSDVEGLGFAIPINTAKIVIEELMEHGYVSGRISLGLTIVDIPDTETAMQYRVSKTGVYVSQVNDETSEFRAGDRIISFNGVTIDDADSLKEAIEQCKIGDTVSVIVERRGERLTFQLTLQEEKPE